MLYRAPEASVKESPHLERPRALVPEMDEVPTRCLRRHGVARRTQP